MKLVIAGSRKVRHPDDSQQKREFTVGEIASIVDTLDSLHRHRHVTEVVSGTAKGADSIGEYWATIRGIPIKRFKPNGARYGWPRAAFVRNAAMAKYGDELFLIWDTFSNGSRHMRDCMIEEHKLITYFYVGWDHGNELDAAGKTDHKIGAARQSSVASKGRKV